MKNKIDIKVRYDNADNPLKHSGNGDWIDLFTAEDAVLKQGEFRLISLGISMELPVGVEANIVPRSSTFGRYGVIQTNSYAVIDSSYNGDEDIWKFPAYATRDAEIPKGTRICQFRLNETMRSKFGDVEFVPVFTLGNAARGGFGSTGK